MPAYLMYLRKSRADAEAEARGEGETLSRHKTMLMALAARNRHHIPPENIYQEVVSGESIADRPQVQLLLERLRQGSVAGVYVMELERLARGDTIDQGTIARSFKYSGAKIITPMKTYDPHNEFDEEYFEFGLFMSRREYKTINRRIQAGRDQSVREGKFIASRAPYGYRRIKIPSDKGYTLTPEPNEAAMVQSIFSWFLHGRNGEEMGVTAIAHALHDISAPLGEHGGVWNACRVYRMLTNEVYAGMIRWGYDKTIRQLTEDGIEKRREITGDYKLYKGLHPALIPLEDFQAVQQKLHNHGHIPVRKTSALSNPLTRLVYCSQCGRAMLGNPGFGRIPPHIKCRTRGCPTVQTAREPVEASILHTLRSWLDTFESGGELPLPHDQDDANAATLAALTALREQLSSLQKQKNRLFDFLEQGVYTTDMFNQRYPLIEEKLKSTQQAIDRNEAELANRPVYKSLAELAPQIRTVLESYSAMPDAQSKNDLLKTVISKISYTKSVKGVPGIPSDQFSLDIYPALK